MRTALSRLRDLLLALLWGYMLFLAIDAWWTAWRAGNGLTQLAAGVWIVVMVVGGIVAAILYFRTKRWNQRFESNHCPACGYDMRATPDRCPECGTDVTSTESHLPAWLNATALELARTRSNRPRK